MSREPGSPELVMNWIMSLCLMLDGDFMLRKSLPWISTSIMPASSMPSLDMPLEIVVDQVDVPCCSTRTSRCGTPGCRNPAASRRSEFLIRRPTPLPKPLATWPSMSTLTRLTLRALSSQNGVVARLRRVVVELEVLELDVAGAAQQERLIIAGPARVRRGDRDLLGEGKVVRAEPFVGSRRQGDRVAAAHVLDRRYELSLARNPDYRHFSRPSVLAGPPRGGRHATARRGGTVVAMMHECIAAWLLAKRPAKRWGLVQPIDASLVETYRETSLNERRSIFFLFNHGLPPSLFILNNTLPSCCGLHLILSDTVLWGAPKRSSADRRTPPASANSRRQPRTRPERTNGGLPCRPWTHSARAGPHSSAGRASDL